MIALQSSIAPTICKYPKLCSDVLVYPVEGSTSLGLMAKFRLDQNPAGFYGNTYGRICDPVGSHDENVRWIYDPEDLATKSIIGSMIPQGHMK